MTDVLTRLRRQVLAHRPEPDGTTAVPNLFLAVLDRQNTPATILYEPLVCVVLQGVKEVSIGSRILRFEAGGCFISTVQLPAMSAVLEAHDPSPYLAISLTLDLDMLSGLIDDVGSGYGTGDLSGFALDDAPDPLLEALSNLLALLDCPEDIPALARGREREVLYRLLRSEHGSLLRRAVRDGDNFGHVRRAIEHIRSDPIRPTSIAELAEIAGMSVASLHRHFKAITSYSPLQYQKVLRLQAARRLLASQRNVTRTALAVGYESPSQFSRDYTRLFGLSPSRDARNDSPGVIVA